MIDVQSSQSLSPFAIDRVGVTHLKYPFVFEDYRDGRSQEARVDPHNQVEQIHTVGDWTLSVALGADKRGTHMSRLIEQLHQRSERSWTLLGLYQWAEGLRPVMEAEVVDAKVHFTIFRAVTAPKSGKQSFLELPVTFQVQTTKNPQIIMIVDTYAKTLCPCSKAISDRGAHNQRSRIRSKLYFKTPLANGSQNKTAAQVGYSLISPRAVAQLVESCASAPIFPILKRADEKFITETAYDHPGFVEDVVRAVAGKLQSIENLAGFTAEVVNYESIHAHDCYATISWRA